MSEQEPQFVWVVLFKQIQPGESHGDLGPGPDLECLWVKDRSKLRYLGTIKIERGEEWTWRWRDLVTANGPGKYEILTYLDEACRRPTGLTYYGVSFTDEEDIEGWRLYPKDWTLTEAQVADLEHGLAGAIAVGNAAPAESLSLFYERAERWEDVKRVTSAGMRAADHDHGIWKFYDEGARSARNVHRRLLSRHNRAAAKIHGPGRATLYSNVDCGEARPDKTCEKCAKLGALPAEDVIGAVWLCYVCRALPRSEWPEPKPLPALFSGFRSFEKPEPRPEPPPPPQFKLGTKGVTFKSYRTCSRVSGGKCHHCRKETYFGYGAGKHRERSVVLCKKCLARHEELVSK